MGLVLHGLVADGSFILLACSVNSIVLANMLSQSLLCSEEHAKPLVNTVHASILAVTRGLARSVGLLS